MAVQMRQPCLSQRGIVSVGIVAVDQGSKHLTPGILARCKRKLTGLLTASRQSSPQ
jgi:hypothetical protein